MKKGKKPSPEPVSIPVYTMEQMKARPGLPVPEGCQLEDIPEHGYGSIIWIEYPDGGKKVDYPAMAARDRAIEKGLN